MVYRRRPRVAKNIGVHAPKKITEHEIQCGVVKHFRAKGYIIHGDSNGVSVSMYQRQKMKSSGAMWGWPDIIFALSGGQVLFIELKRKGGTEQENQKQLRGMLTALGHHAHCVVAKDIADGVAQIQVFLDAIPHRVIFFPSQLDHYHEPAYTQADLEEF